SAEFAGRVCSLLRKSNFRQLVRRRSSALPGSPMKFVSATLGFAAMVVVSTGLLTLLGSGLNIHVATAAVVCAAIVALAAWVTTAPHALPKAHFWDWLMLIVFALVSLRAFLWLFFSPGDGIFVCLPDNFGH